MSSISVTVHLMENNKEVQTKISQQLFEQLPLCFITKYNLQRIKLVAT